MMEKTRRELELEKVIIQNKIQAIQLREMLENSIFVKNKMIEKVERIITNSEL